MLITSTTRIAGTATKKASAPHPSDAHGLRPSWRCRPRSCRGMSAAATRARTRKNAVWTSQPKKLRPSMGLKIMPRPAQLRKSPPFDAGEGVDLAGHLGAGRPREFAAEEKQRGLRRRQVLADDRVRAELDVAAEGRDRLAHGAVDRHVAAERDHRVGHAPVDRDVAAEGADRRHRGALGHDHVLAEPHLGPTLQHRRTGARGRWLGRPGRGRLGRLRRFRLWGTWSRHWPAR